MSRLALIGLVVGVAAALACMRLAMRRWGPRRDPDEPDDAWDDRQW